MSNFEKKSGMGEGGVEAKHPLAPPSYAYAKSDKWLDSLLPPKINTFKNECT